MTNTTAGDLNINIEAIDQIEIGLACEHFAVTVEFVEALVIEGALDGVLGHYGTTLIDYPLTQAQYRQLRRAARLHHDLGINPPGIALALELLQRLELSRD